MENWKYQQKIMENWKVHQNVIENWKTDKIIILNGHVNVRAAVQRLEELPQEAINQTMETDICEYCCPGRPKYRRF